MTDKQYRYIGDGEGIPGLPHLLTAAWAEQHGVLGLMQDAIAAGKYEEITPKKAGKDAGKEKPENNEVNDGE